ncbi:TPA: hypothetical protein HA231_00825 [Candidatus Woesearchaeota archaeon]|nr:hypothetical protein [Candidatus Woesearchaeota archaeon]
MSLPTELNAGMVSDLFFRHVKELSIRALNELKDGRKLELRLVRSIPDLQPTLGFLKA